MDVKPGTGSSKAIVLVLAALVLALACGVFYFIVATEPAP